MVAAAADARPRSCSRPAARRRRRAPLERGRGRRDVRLELEHRLSAAELVGGAAAGEVGRLPCRRPRVLARPAAPAAGEIDAMVRQYSGREREMMAAARVGAAPPRWRAPAASLADEEPSARARARRRPRRAPRGEARPTARTRAEAEAATASRRWARPRPRPCAASRPRSPPPRAPRAGARRRARRPPALVAVDAGAARLRVPGARGRLPGAAAAAALAAVRRERAGAAVERLHRQRRRRRRRGRRRAALPLTTPARGVGRRGRRPRRARAPRRARRAARARAGRRAERRCCRARRRRGRHRRAGPSRRMLAAACTPSCGAAASRAPVGEPAARCDSCARRRTEAADRRWRRRSALEAPPQGRRVLERRWSSQAWKWRGVGAPAIPAVDRAREATTFSNLGGLAAAPSDDQGEQDAPTASAAAFLVEVDQQQQPRRAKRCHQRARSSPNRRSRRRARRRR